MNPSRFSYSYNFLASLAMRATHRGGIRHPWELPAFSFYLVVDEAELGVAIGNAGEPNLVPGEPARDLMLRLWVKDAWELLEAGSSFQLKYGHRYVGEGRIIDRLGIERLRSRRWWSW